MLTLPGAYEYLDTIQKLLFAGKNVEAQEVMASHFICKGVGSARAKSADYPYGSYQLLGNLGIQYAYGADTANLKHLRTISGTVARQCPCYNHLYHQ